MNLGMLNRAALWVCILCLLSAVGMVMVMIWSDSMSSDFAWKAWSTVGVFFVVSLITMTISKKFQDREIESRKAKD